MKYEITTNGDLPKDLKRQNGLNRSKVVIHRDDDGKLLYAFAFREPPYYANGEEKMSDMVAFNKEGSGWVPVKIGG